MNEKKVTITIKDNGDITLENKNAKHGLALGLSMLTFIKVATSSDLNEYLDKCKEIYDNLNN